MKPILFRAAPAQVQKSLLLTAFSFYILAGIFSPLWADDDYMFRDENYEIIRLPIKPVINMQKPGPLLDAAPSHIPKITIKSRKEGLEKIRILQFEFPHAEKVDASGIDRRMAIYVVDKDNHVVGYQALKSTESRYRVSINSVINYVRIYVECYKHGLWTEDFYIRG